jgi:hypothetical protein
MKKILWLPVIGLGLLGYWFRKKTCWHEYLRRVDGDRVFLECATCGRQTPGWTIDVSEQFRRR